MQLKSALMLSALASQIAVFAGTPASALPLGPATGGNELAARLNEASPTIQVRNGAGIAAGVIGGMILGGMIASQYPRYYYDDYPPYPAYRSYPMGDGAIDYCMRRFRSYDPHSMTYLGYDGLRHPCP